NVLPLTPEISVLSAAIEDHPRPPQEPQIPLWSTAVTPEHLDTLGIRLLEGRGFTAADRRGAPTVVLISRATARRFWPDHDPVGRRLRPLWEKNWWTIVGVLDDVKYYGINGPPAWVEGEVYIPMAQAQGVFLPQTISLVARLEGDSSGFEQHLPAMV